MNFSRTFAKLLLIAALAAAQPSLAMEVAATDNTRSIVVENVSRTDFAGTLTNLKSQLAADGWNVVAEIDLGERLARKNVVIPGGLVILELTSGKNALPLLKSDATRYVSALMPCSVSVYGMSDGRVMVARMNAGLLAGMLEPKVAEVMQQAAVKLDESIGRALAKSAN